MTEAELRAGVRNGLLRKVREEMPQLSRRQSWKLARSMEIRAWRRRDEKAVKGALANLYNFGRGEHSEGPNVTLRARSAKPL